MRAEALTCNLGSFARFLLVASLSQPSQMSVSVVARELCVARKTVDG
jgi:hypothetical protein